MIMSACDRICKSLAKSIIDRGKLTPELRTQIVKYCFTSPEGILKSFYLKEKRKETTQVEEVNSKGKVRLVKREKTITGHRIPSLFIGSELLTLAEKAKLKKYDARFNLPAVVR